MLKADTIKKIETLLKVTGLEAAIKDANEVDITIDEKITVLTEDEVTTLKTNEYRSGKEKGVEMAVKEAKEKLKLDFTGKTVDGLLDAHGKKVLADAKIEPAQKVTELEGKISTLQATVTDQEKKLADKDSEVIGIQINSELHKYIPAPGESGPALAQDEIISLMKSNGYEFKKEEGKVVPYKAGKQLIDKLSNALPVKEVIESFLKEKKLISDTTPPGGRGGGDNKPPVSARSIKELKEQYAAAGKSALGEEFMTKVTELKKADPEFKME